MRKQSRGQRGGQWCGCWHLELIHKGQVRFQTEDKGSPSWFITLKALVIQKHYQGWINGSIKGKLRTQFQEEPKNRFKEVQELDEGPLDIRNIFRITRLGGAVLEGALPGPADVLNKPMDQ